MADPTVRPISAADITTWDYEADVVVAGYGIMRRHRCDRSSAS